MSRHTGINWHKQYCQVGQRIPVYPHRGDPFWATVTAITKNKSGRISYRVEERNYDVMAEELFPGKDDVKLRMKGNV